MSSPSSSTSSGAPAEGAPKASPPVASGRAKHSPWVHTASSQGAAAIATVTFFPVDVVRMRFMSQDGTATRMHNQQYYKSTASALRSIFREEGLSSLFRGAHVAVGGATCAWGAYMYLYRSLNEHFAPEDEFWRRSLTSSAASCTSAVLTNPIFLVKTRMQVEDRSRGAGEQHYRTFRGSMRHIIQTTGPTSLWRGLSAQLLLGLPNSLNLPIYDSLKKWRLEQTGGAALAVPEVLACSVATKTTLLLVSHPIFVIKTRLQDHRARVGDVQYVGVADAVLTTAKREGLAGLYRGTGPALVQAVPRAVFHFFVYEGFLRMLAPLDKKR